MPGAFRFALKKMLSMCFLVAMALTDFITIGDCRITHPVAFRKAPRRWTLCFLMAIKALSTWADLVFNEGLVLEPFIPLA